MWLHRVTPDPFQPDKISPHNIGQKPDRFGTYYDAVIAKFDRFGNGARRSDFEVGIEWSDIESLIARFVENKHPSAIEIENALKLAKAAREVGWTFSES